MTHTMPGVFEVDGGLGPQTVAQMAGNQASILKGRF